MATTATYVQLQELKSRLPHVQDTVLSYFLSKYNGDVDECYAALMDGYVYGEGDPSLPGLVYHGSPPTPVGQSGPLHPAYPYDATIAAAAHDYARNRYDGMPHVVPSLSNAQGQPVTPQRPEIRRMDTYPAMRYGGDERTLPDQLMQSWPASGEWTRRERVYTVPSSGRDPRDVVASPMPMHGSGATTLPRHAAPSLPHQVTPSLPRQTSRDYRLVMLQRKRLEERKQERDGIVTQLSVLRRDGDEKKRTLSRLRVEVSEGIQRQPMLDVQDVIKTLQFDVQQAKSRFEMHKMNAQMKEDRYDCTEEGMRWTCGHCTFLNHPLMNVCESCEMTRTKS